MQGCDSQMQTRSPFLRFILAVRNLPLTKVSPLPGVMETEEPERSTVQCSFRMEKFGGWQSPLGPKTVEPSLST